MEEKRAMITIKTKQSDGNNTEQTEIITSGKYKKTDDGYVMSYNDTEATGYEGSKTTLTVFDGDEKVIMSRTGSSTSQLTIEKGVKHHCHYGTPYGPFMLGITANDIMSSLTDDGGKLNFKYVIDIDSGYMGDFDINITVKAN